MDPNQHGLRSKSSCLSQLLEHHKEILRILETREIIDFIYLGFLKAFDRVGIGILLRYQKDYASQDNMGGGYIPS